MHPFLNFLKSAPTPYHAVHEAEKALLQAGFDELKEEKGWKLKKGQGYFVKRGGSLLAFRVPKSSFDAAVVLASHTDSPALKLKPYPEYVKEDLAMVGVEVYGAPLLNSWLNRDLAIAGRVLYRNKKGAVEESLVDLQELRLTIPQLAIHLDRKVNEEGLQLNKQEHLNALFGINPPKEGFLLHALKKTVKLEELLAHDLYLYPVEPPQEIGAEKELIAGYRLDNLASLYPSLHAFINGRVNDLKILALWDHEEIGSQTPSGAESPFFSHTFERILLGLQIEREEQLRILSNSLCVSIDLTHAVNPNFPDKQDPRHKPTLGGGVYIKTSAQKRYATEAPGTKRLFEASKKAKIPLHFFVPRNDFPSGSTIGPIHATLTGMATVDIGIAQLSMHSARELIAKKDLLTLEKFLTAM